MFKKLQKRLNMLRRDMKYMVKNKLLEMNNTMGDMKLLVNFN